MRIRRYSFLGPRMAALLAALLWLHSHTAAAATQTVINVNNSGAGSLRNTIAASSAGDTIIFAVNGTITLTSGELAIGTTLTIVGPGADLLTISGNDASRVFNVTAGTVRLSGLTIAHGGSGAYGGGILNSASSTVEVSGCTIADNDAHDGGGIANLGTLTVSNSTFFGNGYDSGGGLRNNGTATVINCTFADNHASIGAGIYNASGTLTLLNSTIVENSSGGSPGGLAQNATANIQNTIIARNSFSGFPNLPQDVGGAVTSLGHNLIGKSNGSSGWVASDLTGTMRAPLDPLVGPLQDNGGPTFTAALLPGSPAIDAGRKGGPDTDQRGRPRPYDNLAIPNSVGGNGCDIGAFEVGVREVANLVVFNNNDSGAGSLRQAIANVSVYAVPTITFAPHVTGTITLTSGELAINVSTTIVGPGASNLAVNGNLTTPNGSGASRVFNITSGTVRLSGLTITKGYDANAGGGIFNSTALALANCTLFGNSAANGGGIYNDTAGTLSLHNATFSTNRSTTGGGLVNRGVTSMTNCTLTGNLGNNGGAIYHQSGTLTVVNCTVAGNSTGTGGSVYISSGVARLRNTIIAGNTSPTFGPDAFGVFASQGHNLIGKTDNSSGWIVSDLKGTISAPLNPELGPLQDNGGPTFTRALLTGSPAIDAGSSGGTGVDQRGRPRPYDHVSILNVRGGDGSDIGAVELVPPALTIRRSGQDALLSWPVDDPGYTLESAGALLSLPSANVWTTVPGRPVIVGGEYRVTIANAFSSGRFYRLRSGESAP